MTINQKPHFFPGKRKYLIYADKTGMSILQTITETVQKLNMRLEVFAADDGVHQLADFTKWLGRQKMGSYLYISVPWIQLHNLKLIAEEAGYCEEESQYIGHGERKKRIFCCRCHHITVTSCSGETGEKEVSCGHCGLLLEVTTHYSTLRDAYMGYFANL